MPFDGYNKKNHIILILFVCKTKKNDNSPFENLKNKTKKYFKVSFEPEMKIEIFFESKISETFFLTIF